MIGSIDSRARRVVLATEDDGDINKESALVDRLPIPLEVANMYEIYVLMAPRKSNS